MRYRFPTLAAVVLLGAATAAHADTKQPEQQRTSTEGAQRVENVDLFFATDSAQLSGSASSDLQELADWVRCDPQRAIILEGHADPRGSKDHNLTLSGERAAAVRERLIQLGVPSERVVITVYGENGPREPTYSKDRRVTARATQAPVKPDDLAG
jgi:outer membrane protein OmpA-like peptidoglycan-associated protein